jgi:hypothetical protein
MRNVYKVLARKPEGKRLLRRCRHRWENNIGIALKKIVCEGVDWMHLTQYRCWYWALVKVVVNFGVS